MAKVLNFNIFENETSQIDIYSNKLINTINPHSYCVAKIDKDFEKVLQNSDILLPDGVGIVWATKVLSGKKITKIAGYDLFIHTMNQLNANNDSCFFLGASSKTLELIEKRVKKDFPNVRVNTFSPPYKSEFSQEENEEMILKVNEANPTALFVGMTAPKQEKWAFKNKERLNVNCICSIGAVFDFYAGTVKRPNSFWIKLGLEWLPRFLKEPKRLATRNLVSSPKFVLEVFSFKFFKKGIL